MQKKYLSLSCVLLGCVIATQASSQAPAPQAADSAMQGYYGNSAVLRDQSGKAIEIIYYRPDGTLRQWRDVWAEGPWVLNNGQDNSTLCKWQETPAHTVPKVWCHAFAPNKHVGDHWIMPENKGGHPEVVGGIAVVKANGKWAIPNAPANAEPPAEVWSLEKGLVLPSSIAK